MKALPLNHNDFVQILGPDCKKFLQGQVSCNIDLLSRDKSLRGVLCNLKGRVIADFRAIQAGEAIWLQTEAGMGQQLIDVLSKYAVFSKVEISLVSLTGKIIGLFHEREIEPFANLPEPPPLADLPADDDAVVSGDDCIVIKLPAVKSKYQVISLNTKGDALLAKVLELAETATEAEWAMLDIEIGILHINEQDSEQFTPQLLNYDISGVIDFKKGCYTGQEIVARMFYRSTAKKRLQLLSSPLKADAADTIIYSEAGAEKTTGILRIANVPDSTEGSLILAILGMQAIDSLSPPRLLKAVPIEAIEPAINSESFLQFLTLPYIK